MLGVMQNAAARCGRVQLQGAGSAPWPHRVPPTQADRCRRKRACHLAGPGACCAGVPCMQNACGLGRLGAGHSEPVPSQVRLTRRVLRRRRWRRCTAPQPTHRLLPAAWPGPRSLLRANARALTRSLTRAARRRRLGRPAASAAPRCLSLTRWAARWSAKRTHPWDLHLVALHVSLAARLCCQGLPGPVAGNHCCRPATPHVHAASGPQVLLPAESFKDIPLVTPTDAICLLTGLGCRAPALGLNPPGAEEWPAAPAPAPAAAP